MGTARVAIVGAPKRNLHHFNPVFRDDSSSEVVAFTHTASQNIGELDDFPQRRDLEETIRSADCEVVVSITPHDLARIVDVDVPVVRVRYELAERDLILETVVSRHAETLGGR